MQVESEKLKHLSWGYSWVYVRVKHKIFLARLLPFFKSFLKLILSSLLFKKQKNINTCIDFLVYAQGFTNQ
jgi:hypothetical protein